jgi:hypothetical protein
MPLTVPNLLASPEGLRAGLVAAIQADRAGALAAVTAAYPNPPIALPLPAKVSTKEIGAYNEIGDAWPFVSVVTGEMTVTQANEQLGAAQWAIEVFLDAFLQMDDAELLPIALYRYAVALWIVALSHDPIARAQLQYEGMAITPDPSGGTDNSRAVRLSLQYRFRT